MDNYISVIITAYNRKEYILKAIKSALNQTLDKKYYEIIVVKNFNDDEIDNFINKNNIKSILSNNKLLIIDGIKCSQGNIISFLEDDDLFFNNKLETVNKIFNDKNIVYYHNYYYPINDSDEYTNFNNQDITFNMSCISISKNIIEIDKLKNIKTITDLFMYLSALDYGGEIKIDKAKLTYYRFHNSVSNIIIKNFKEYENKAILFRYNCINDLTAFKSMFKSNKSLKCIDLYIIDNKVELLLLGKNQITIKEILKYTIYRKGRFINKSMIIILYPLSKIFPIKSLKLIKYFKKMHFKKVVSNKGYK